MTSKWMVGGVLGSLLALASGCQTPPPTHGEDYSTLPDIIELIGGAGFDRLIVETVGAGQNEVQIRNFVDRTAVVVVPGMGDAIQMDKAGILEIADVFVINKADYAGEDTLKRELLDIAARRPICETIAWRSAIGRSAWTVSRRRPGGDWPR